MTPEKQKTDYQTIIQNPQLTPIQCKILMYLNTLQGDVFEGNLQDIAERISIGKTAVLAQTINLHNMGYLVRENLGKPGGRKGIRLSDFRP